MHQKLFIALALLASCNPDPDPGSCEPATGEGTVHTGIITADETWRSADGPHLIPSALGVRATVTIEPCTVVRVAGGTTITVGDTEGRIVAHGESGAIRFESDSETQAFGGIAVQNGTLDFEHVTIERGGEDGAAIEVNGPDDGSIARQLRLLHTDIVSSAGSGIRLTRGAAFTSDSTDLTITSAGTAAIAEQGHPIDIDPPGIGTIPDGMYAGNREDSIVVRTPWPRVIVDETFREVGVPYRIADSFLMYDPDGADLTLTIEPGVTLRFDRNAGGDIGLTLGNQAAGSEVRLVAMGTALQPITFTSNAPAPAPGDWGGVMMANAPSSGNILSNAIVEYAGGETSTRGYGCGTGENVGGLILIDWLPSEVFVTGSTFRQTRGAGIVSGWRLGAGESPVDLRADNVFEDIVDYMREGHCDVAEWHPDAPDCRVPRRDGITCVGE